MDVDGGFYYKYICNYNLVATGPIYTGSTYTVKQNASLSFYPSDGGFGPGGPVDPPPGGDYSAKITLPRDGFKQAKLNSVALLINYKVPYDGDMKKVGIKIDGYRKDRPNDILSHDVKVSPDGSILEGFLRVAGAVPWNVETALKVEITDYTGRVHSDSVTVTCFDDFVDANGDGKDDRTNEDEWEGNPDYGDPDNPSIGGGVLPDMAGVIDSISGFTSGFVNMLASFFTFLPGEIIALLVFGIAVIIVLRIIGR